MSTIIVRDGEHELARDSGRRIRQQRSRKTHAALIATGFRLLDKHEFESITVADLAREAGYSVGAFYSRFRSKDEFLDALVAQHLEQRTRARARVLATSTPDSLIENLVRDLVGYYWKRRLFWRAALQRGMRDPSFWKHLEEQGQQTAAAVVAKFSEIARRKLTEAEVMDVKFAYHFVLGAVNNSIVNRPGPALFLDRERFIRNLVRTFRLVSNYDSLLA